MTIAHTSTRRRRRAPALKGPDTYPKGRRCALGECGCDAPAILSIYNPDETCAVCTVKLDQAVRRAEPAGHAPVRLHRDGFVLNRGMVDALREAVHA